MKITVLKWDEYQPRKDVKRSSWFRMEHAIFLSTKHLNLKLPDVAALLYILSLCSEENSKTVEIVTEHVAIFSRLKPDQFFDAVKKLQELGLVRGEITSTSRGKHASGSLRTNGHNERTDINTSTEASAPPPASEPSSLFDLPDKEIGVIKEFFEIKDSLRGRVKYPVQKKWLELYDAEFIIRKIKELDLWCLNNTHKAPRTNWSAFYSRCMSKDWEKYRTTLPSNRPGTSQKSSYAIEQEKLNAPHAK